MRPKVLWIEDGARKEATALSAPVYSSGKYDFEIALDATDGMLRLMHSKYDAVIVDIRIGPGNDRKWIELFLQSGEKKEKARLGIQLLYSFIMPDKAEIRLAKIPDWIEPKVFGVLSIETEKEAEGDLKNLGINFYKKKQATIPTTTLLDFIDEIIMSKSEQRSRN